VTDLRLERMVHGALSLARLPGGRLVLVRGGIPGELVRGRIAEVSGVLRADAEEVVEPSEDRLPAPAHPGLDYGHIRYPRQLGLKREVVVDALGRALPAALEGVRIEAVRPSPAIWRYRSAVQPVVTAAGLGYRLPGSAAAVELPDDPVANPAIAGAWRVLQRRSPPKGVREIALRGNDRGEVLLALIATSPQRTLLPYSHELVAAGVVGVAYARFDARGRFRGGSERLAGARRIWQAYGELELSVSATSFAQPNPGAAGALYRDATATAGTGRAAVELFAGSGAIAMYLARSFERVEAVEIDRGSVSRGREDARRLGIENLVFHAEDARRAEIPGDAELVAVDPPRSGLGRETRELIDSSKAERLLYISCDPATWARDVAAFAGSGWRLDVARPYDFYPHTHHVEMLSLLSR
jgi:23S rRNA (uracil1939-C5)-methyltransferase